jgi:hypothetical protein
MFVLMVMQLNHRQKQQECEQSTYFVAAGQSGSRSGALHCSQGPVWGQAGNVRIHTTLFGAFFYEDISTGEVIRKIITIGLKCNKYDRDTS